MEMSFQGLYTHQTTRWQLNTLSSQVSIFFFFLIIILINESFKWKGGDPSRASSFYFTAPFFLSFVLSFFQFVYHLYFKYFHNGPHCTAIHLEKQVLLIKINKYHQVSMFGWHIFDLSTILNLYRIQQ